jgi:hypothetical protein
VWQGLEIAMTLKPRTFLILIALCFLGVALDLHNMHVADLADKAHDRSIASLTRSSELTIALVKQQQARIDKLQLLLENQGDGAADQADQLIDLDKRLRAFERNEEKVCEEKW